VDLIHFGARLEPNDSVLGGAIFSGLQLDSTIEVDKVFVPFVHLRGINCEGVGPTAEGAWPASLRRFLRLCLNVLRFWGVRQRLLRVGTTEEQRKQQDQGTYDR